MKFIVSRYNNDIEWVKDYTDDFVVFDRSEIPLDWPQVHVVPNIGSDIYDKFKYIVDNYDNLPDVAVYTKGNLFKYMPREEFDAVKDNKVFTPLLTKNHVVDGVISMYNEDGVYMEVNDAWILNVFPDKASRQFAKFLGVTGQPYFTFAPGANYILPKENILKHPKEFYQKCLEYIGWDRYPAEAQLLERSLYHIWR